MNYAKLILITIMMFLSAQTQAMQWGELRKLLEEGTKAEHPELLMERLNEAVLMLVVYSRHQHELNPKDMLFCPPKGRPFQLQDLLKVISAQAKIDKANDTTLVQQLLLDGFRREFPCSDS